MLKINWPEYLIHYVRGIQIWVMNFDLIVPEAKLDQIVLQNSRGYEDLKKTMAGLTYSKSSEQYESRILNRQRFDEFISFNGQKSMITNNLGVTSSIYDQLPRFDRKLIASELQRLRCSLEPKSN